MTGTPYEPPRPQPDPYANQSGWAEPTTTVPYQQPTYGQQPYQQPTGGYDTQPYAPVQVSPYAAYRVGLEHPQGTVVLVLGILGFFTFVTGIIAWVMGRKALKEMDASGQYYSNRSQTQVGYVLGIVSSILGGIYVLAIVAYIIFVVVLVASFGATG